MPVNDNMKWVYDQLTQSGANMGTIDDFEKAMGDENNRKWAYDYANSKGMNLGSMDDFTKAIMPAVPTTQQETYPQEVVDRFNSPDNKPGSFKDMATINREYQQLQKAKADVQAEEAAKAVQFGNVNMVSTPNGMMPDLRSAGRRVRAQQPATQQPVQQEQTQQPQVQYPFAAEQNVGDQMWDIAHMHDNEKQETPRFDYRHAENGFVNPATQKSDDRQTFTEGLKRAKEDDEILKKVTLKPEATADDVYENAMMRFSNTEEGIAMQDEADEAMRQHLATLQDEFTRSKEYKDIVSQKPTTEEEAEQMTERLNQAFQEKYGAEMEKFMQPYQEKMMEAVQNRYGESISEGMRKVNAKAAGQQVTDLQSQVNELQAKRGQTGSGTLRAANHLLEETQEVIDAANRGDTGFLKELGQGFWDNLDARNFTWGISDALDSTNLKIALEAAEKGEQLSKEQEALLDAHAVNMIVSAYFGSDLSRGYKAGQMTAESLPFMLDIITNPISASGNAVAKGLLKYGMKRFGAKAVNRAVPRFLGRVAGESVAAAGMTSTTGLPRVLGETMDRLNANFNVTIGDDGKPQVQRVDNKSTMEALSEAVRSNFFEYQSESVFNALRGFNPLKGMMSKVMPEPVNKIIGAVKSSGVGRVYKNTFGNKTMKEIAQRAQFHGLPEEYMEEVYNNFANVATGDMSLKDATDLDKNIDTFLGLAPTSVLFGAIGVGGYAHERYQNRKNMNRAFGQMNDQQREQLAQLQEMAAGNQKEAINREVKRFLQETIAADNLTQEEKRAEIEYLFEFVKQNAIGEIDAERTPEERAVDDAEESRMAGYDTTDPAAMNEAKNDYEAALADIEGSFSPEAIAAIDANPVEELRLTYMNPSYSDEDRQRVLDYVNAKQRYDGMVQRVRDDIDGMIQASDAEIDSQVNTGTGMVQPATLKVDNRQVHIIDGNVALLEDGSIDTANSTQDIIVRDAQTGKVEFVSPSAFLGVDEAMDPAALKQQAAENIRQTKAQQAADQIDGVLPFQQGDTYDGVDAEGQPVQVQIISDNGDGTVNVGINGEAAGEPMQKEAVQQLVDNARRAQAVARREDAASQRAKNTNLSEPSRSMTEGRDAYSLNEEIGVTLPDGSIGSAVINAEQNADGQYEVELRDEAGNPVGVQLLTADQLNAMQPAEAQAEAERQPAPTKEAVSSDLNGEQEQPAEQAAETPSAEAAPEVVPQNDTTDAMPMIGEGEDMEPDFAHATPQRTQQYLYEESGLEQDEADDFVKDMKKRAQTEKTKLEGKKPKLSDRGIDNKIPRFQRAKAEWQGKVDEAQRKVDYWNSVEQEQQMKQRQAREAAEAERLAAMTDEERLAQQRLTEQDAQNLEEIAAQMIGSGSIKLNRDSYKQETGYSESEAKKMFRIFATDGMSVSRAGEQIEQAAREAGIPFDETDANAGRNAVISVLQSAETWGNLLHYIEKNRQAEADALLRAAEREQEELLDRLAVAYNFASGEDYRAYEEFYLPMYLSELDAATGEEYYAAIADDINHLNEIENGERTDNSEGEGSSAVLPEEQPSVGNRESTAEGQVESEGSTGEVPSEERPASEEASRGEVEIAPSDQLKPIGRGAFGDIYDQFRGKPSEAIAFLIQKQDGEALGALHHKDIGEIDLVWGKAGTKKSDGYGLAKLVKYHPEVLDNLQEILDDMHVTERSENRIQLESETHQAAVRLTWDNKKKNWLLTAFEKKETSEPTNSRTDVESNLEGMSDDTATRQDSDVSESKDNTSSDNIQENQQENEIQGLRGYSEKDVADLVRTHIEEQMEGEDFEIVDIKVIGSRTRGEARPDSDLDVLVEYKGRMKEDTAFNILNDEDSRLTIEDIPVDINPITAGKSGTIEQWMKRNADYKKDIETARKEVAQNPTEAQKEAGNYKKGHIKLDGYDISIENPKGSTRSGVDEQGKEWSVTMNNDYGYLRGTEGVDGDHIDVFLSDDPTSGNIYVIDQVNPNTGEFDEHKVMYGFADANEAKIAYFKNYSKGWKGYGKLTAVTREEFKKWVESSHRKTKPFAEYKSVKPISGQNEVSVVRGEGYTITPTIYKKKSGGMLDMQLVKFDKLTPEQKKTLSGLARQMKGWWSREDEGFLMRSMEDAERLTNAVQAPTQEVTPAEEQKQEERVEVEKPQQRLSQYYSEMEEDVYEKRLTRLREKYKNGLPSNEELENKIQQFSKEVKQYEEEVDNASEQEKPFAQGRLASASGSLRAFRTFKNEIRKKKTEQERDAVLKEKGLKIGDKVIYKGKEAILYDIDNGRPVLDTGMSPVIYELVEWEDVTIPAQANQSGNKIVTDARYEELKERMRKKLGGQMNLGIDPEILTIGIEMAVYHIEKGSRKFADYAKAMIADLGDAIRPYLKAFYNGARDLPEVGQAGWNTEMDSADNVSRFDVANFDKPSIDAMATAEEVTKEQEVKQQAEEAVSQVTSIAEQPKLRPATEEDLEGNPAVYYKGRRYRIVMLMRQGSQVSATEFEKPRITSVVLTNMESVSPSELMVEDTPTSTPVAEQPKNDEAKPKESKKKPAKKAEKAQPMSLDLFAQFDAENEPANNEENNRNNEENSVTSQSNKPNNKNEDGSEKDNRRTNRESYDGVSTGESTGSRSTDGERLESGLQERRNDRRGDSSAQEGNKQVRSSSERSSGRIPQLEPTEAKNTRNFHIERGQSLAPASPKVRYDANVAAIRKMQDLMESGAEATPADKMILAKFSGWGGLGAFLNDYDSKTQLQNLLGADGYEQAAMSANSAFYTPASVIDTLWDVAKRLGFKGGNVLEGSAGIGDIIGHMPTDMSQRSSIEAVEIDEVTGNILKLLYPDAKVNVQGFEQTKIPNGSVDLAITNVPFVTGLKVFDDSGDKDLSKRFGNIHDFCIAKNVRKLREGGIGIFITSSGTMDRSDALRAWVTNEGGSDFIGAFRLNNKTFGGTSVTSDIIIIRKRVNGQRSEQAINVGDVSAERVVDYETGETKRKNGKEVPVVKKLSMLYNNYFMEHPENMAGKMDFGFEHGDTYRPESAGLFPNGQDQNKMLAEWLDRLPSESDLQQAPSQNADSQASNSELAGENTKEGQLISNSKGEICISRGGVAEPLNLNANKVKGHTKEECLQAYDKIKKALSDVLDYQVNNEDDKGLKPLLSALNKAYDDFVSTYGYLNRNTSISFLRNDVDFASIAALENYEERGDKKGNKVVEVKKAAVFNGRVVNKEAEPEPKSVSEAVTVSIYKHGRLDVPYMAEKLGMEEDAVRKEIIKSGLGFENPLTTELEVSFEYLSGNVREKLEQAREANEDGRYDKNIKALEKVIPADIPAHLIEFSIGSSWVDPKLYQDYVKDRTGKDVRLSRAGGSWAMHVDYGYSEKNSSFGVRSELLQKVIPGTELIDAAMNNKTITVKETRKDPYTGETITTVDKDATQACANKIDEIRQDFKDWARAKMQSDPDLSNEIAKVYNDKFNNFVPRTIPNEFVPEHFVGASTRFNLREHQGKAAVRATMQPVLLAHEVGTGKTFTMITAAMEMRRLGLAKKPMIVVQNATTGQFAASAKDLYPNAKVLTLDEADRTAEGRKNFYAKIKYNDWDMIIVPQSVFDRIPDSEERQIAYIQDKIAEKMAVMDEIAANDDSGAITRQAQKEIDALEEELATISEALADKKRSKDEKRAAKTRQNAAVKAREMLDREVDEVENFDDMEIDAILIDEAHEYKHLGFATAMQRGVKGIDPSYSKKAQGAYLKIQAVKERKNGKNVVMATGTPISNTAAEIWTFMRYLLPKEQLQAYDIYYFDDFVRNFGNITQMLEFATNGRFKENNRFAGYSNLPELIRIWSGAADTVKTDEAGEVKSKIPELETGKAQDIYLPQSRSLRAIMAAVKAELKRYDEMSGKEKKANSHIPLTMYGIAKAAAIDPRLVSDEAIDEPLSKTNKAVEETLRSLNDTKSYNGTVAIFCDNYQNKHTGFNLYEEIKRKLIANGVPEDQIFIMRSGLSDKKKAEVFAKMNRGEIRVMLGSTFTLGTGVNIQERLHTLIHLDAPNRPMDYTQRNGRILRQGNLHRDWNKPVRVLRFGVEDSLDVTAYQRLKTKGAIADSVMNGKSMMNNNQENRYIEEEEDVFGDTVAQLSGSEYAMLKNQAEKEYKKLLSKKQQHTADQIYVHNAIPKYEGQIKANKEILTTIKAGLKKVEETFPDGKAKAITVGNSKFSSIDGMADFIKDVVNKRLKETEDALRSRYGNATANVNYTVKVDGITFEVKAVLRKESTFRNGVLSYVVHTDMTYDCEELGLESVPVSRGSFRNAMLDIIGNVITGNDLREREEAIQNRIERKESELAQIRERDGKPFPLEKELKAAEDRVGDLTEKMQKELAEKEAKYTEMDSDVEAVNINSLTDAEEEDGDTTTTSFQVSEDTIQRRSQAQKMATNAVLQALQNAKVPVQTVSDKEALQMLLLSMNGTDWKRVRDAAEAGRRYGQQRYYVVNLEDPTHINEAFYYETKDAAQKDAAYYNRLGWGSFVMLDLDSEKNVTSELENPERIAAQVEFLKVKGKVYGWTDGKTIYLTKRGMNPNTTIHEYTHLWAASLQRTNPELWGQVKDLLRSTPVWADVTEDTNYRNIWNNEDAIASEALSRISGRENGNYLTKLSERAVRENGALDAASIIDRVRRALDFFWNWVGTHVFGMKEFRNIGQVTDRILYDLMSGEQLTFEQGEEMAFNVAPESYQPTKTGKGYKVFVLKDGQLYPPMVANPNGAATPVGVWLEAHAAPVAGTSKTGRPQVKAGGKGTQGGSGTLAYRPGWHLGEIPYAKQFNRKDESGEKQLFPNNFVWAEVEYANDVDYQEEARKEGTNENGKYQHSLAGLKRVPENGSYRYRTNPDPTTDEWIITGAMKVNRILTPSEVDAMVRAAGREPQKRQEGAVTDEQVNELNEQLGLADSGVRFREIYRRNSEVAYNFARKNKGVGRVAVITAENGYDILRQRGLSADKAREYMEEFKSGLRGLCLYGNDLIVAFDNGNVSEEKINSYLWHEAGHRVVRYYNIPKEWIDEIAEYTKADSPEFYEDIQQLYSDHSESDRNEEYITFMLEELGKMSDKEIIDGLELLYNSEIPVERYMGAIINIIRYGTEERNNGLLQETRSIDQKPQAVEMRNDEAAERGRSQAEEAIEQEVNRLADKLGVPVTIVHYVSELPQSESEARKRIDEGRMVKGWYNNGRIFVYVPNTEDAADAKRTMVHEIVAHYGLRKLLGKRFNDFMLEVYEHADLPIRQQIERLAARYDWDFVTATEEYLASLAENTNFDEAKRSGWWARIKQAFYRILEDMGFGRLNGKLTDNELRYLLWRSYDNLQRERENRQRDIFDEAADTAMQYELGVGDYMEPTETSRFRITMRDKATVRTEYEKMVQSGTFQFREAVQDSMRGLHAMYKAVLGNGFTTIENVPGYENAYLAENRMSSQSAAEQHDYFNRYMQPLLKAIGKIAGKDAAKREELTDYMMAKHGLERNVVLAERDARIAQQGGGDYDQALQKNRERDYAGLTALTGESDLGAAELMAQQMVDDYENTHDAADIQALWDAVKDASHATLEKLYKSGLMSGDTYQNTLAMFQNYIPLRGWEETTSDEVYGYLAGNDSPLMGSVLKTAKGRSSKADDPIAYIAQMADKAIMEGNRNRMKQTFMNFVLNHPSDLVSVSDIWMQHDDLRDEWVAVFPELEPDDTAEEVERKLLDFENDMQQLSIADPDHFKRSREHPEIPYRVKKGNLREHQVLVKRNGKTSVLTINGNPRAAQALNGLTNPDVDVKGAVGNLLKMGEYVNRQLSAFYTTRNPDFVVSNFLRDMVYSNVMTWVKENPKYALRFHRNVGRVNPAMMRKLLGKWESGTLNDSNYTERMFRQFMLNGGETGYTSVRDLEKHKQDIAKELKKQGSVGRKAWDALGMQMDLLNRSVENCARFAAFVTSREMGRSIERSIYDAKEVSVNFNKKGSGGKMLGTIGQDRPYLSLLLNPKTYTNKKDRNELLAQTGSYISGLGRVGFVFWNAGVQGMTNFGRAGKRHQKKFIAAAASVFTLGVVVPLLAQLLSDGDDDDKNAYYNLAEYIRRSNIVFYAGDQWVTIPLPIELRALYGLGELATGVITGAERYSDQEMAFQIASQVSQILPLDMLEGGGGLTPFIPSAFKPAVEAYLLNRRWTGLPVFKDSPYNKTDPEWKKAYASTDKTLVAMTRWLNELGGGDDFKKSEWPFMDINPAKLEYLLSGTFGGYVSVAEKLKKMGETAVGERDFEWRNMLIGNRIMTSGDETTEYRKLQNEFYRYKEEADETKRLYNRYQKVQEEGDEADAQKYAEKQEQLLSSDEYRRYEIFEMYKDEINSYDEMMAEAADKEDEAMYKQMKFEVIKEMVEEMRKGE